MDNPTYNNLRVQAVIQGMLESAQERETARKLLAETDSVKLEALRIGEYLAKVWGGDPDILLVQLQGEPSDEFCRELAELLRPVRIILSKVAMVNNPKLARPVNRVAAFAHVAEPSLLVKRLADTMDMEVSLVKIF